MRLPGTKVHRAFPELDRFDDESCRRFIKASNRYGWLSNVGYAGAMLFAAASVFLGVVLAWSWVASRWLWRGFSYMPTAAPAWADGLALVFALIAAGLSALIVRDWLLIRRVRSLIHSRALCGECGYNLMGLSVSAEHRVACPECGHSTSVDPALAELAVGAKGMEFRPAPTKGKTLATARKIRGRKRVLKWFAFSTAGLVLVLALIVGVIELGIRLDARRALAEAHGVEAMRAHHASIVKPAGDGHDAWQIILNANASVDGVNRAASDGLEGLDAGSSEYMPLLFGELGRALPLADEDEFRRRMRAASVVPELIARYRRAGVFETIARLGVSYPSLNVVVEDGNPSADPGDDSNFALTDSITKTTALSSLARIAHDRAHLAHRSGDLSEFKAALRSMVDLASLAEHQPSMLHRLIATRVRRMILSTCLRVLITQPDRAWVDACSEVLQDDWSTPLAYAYEGERIYVQASMRKYFADSNHVRERMVQLLELRVRHGDSTRVGTYSDARDTLDRIFEPFVSRADRPRHQRGPVTQLIGVSDAEPVLLSVTLLAQSLKLFDHHRTRTEGLRILVALEQHRIATGGYPKTLDELAPRFMPTVPVDPWSGRPFSYKPVDPSTDFDDREFLLYAWGPDDADDGGIEVAPKPKFPSSGFVEPPDVVINTLFDPTW